MKTLILYYTEGGATKKCAEYAAARIPGAQALSFADAPELDGFDTVILASNIKKEKLGAPFLRYVKKNADELKARRLGFFLSGGMPETFRKTVGANIPVELRIHSFGIELVGGELYHGEFSKWDKFVLKICMKLMKIDEMPTLEIDYDALDRFIAKANGEEPAEENE